MTYAVTKGETWFRVGETVRYELEGELRPGVSAKDVFLHLAGTYGDHATLNVEYGGPGLAGLSMNARRTLTTMSAELSVEFATFEPDDVMLDFVAARTEQPFEPAWPDADAAYADKRVVRLDQVEPLVALPDAVLNNSKAVDDVSGQAIDQAFIGSCANGTLDDLAIAARVLQGKRVHDGVRLLVTPATQNIYREALRQGYILTITEAGGVVTNATCGACGGGSLGVLGPGETCITASTRNFKGRMGDAEAKIYMASPATVAASAIRGSIASPLEYFQ
jgi:3-isopropylmalate/(R)-2-methylmalate dehydratase large subunit